MTQPRLAQPLYRQACDVLARDIAAGRLPVGERLTQLGIARRFGISRAPARMALQALAQAGLVRHAAGRFEVLACADATAPSPAPDPVLTQQPAWERLYPEIELAIVSHASLASWRVNEAMLARHHGVSRTVARDVVARLQQRGVVRKDDSGRWLAPGLTADHMNELYELRWLLEPVAMEKAVPHLPAGFLAAMQDELQQAMRRDTVCDGAALDRLEHRLHVELLSHCRNGALMQAIALPQALLVAHRFLYRLTLELFGTEPFLGEHLDIVRLLQAGDIAGAKAALVAHLRISRRRALLRIEAVQDMIQPDPPPWLERA